MDWISSVLLRIVNPLRNTHHSLWQTFLTLLEFSPTAARFRNIGLQSFVDVLYEMTRHPFFPTIWSSQKGLLRCGASTAEAEIPRLCFFPPTDARFLSIMLALLVSHRLFQDSPLSSAPTGVEGELPWFVTWQEIKYYLAIQPKSKCHLTFPTLKKLSNPLHGLCNAA